MLSAQAIDAAPKTPSGVQSPRPARFGARSDAPACSPTAVAPSAPARSSIRREKPERSSGSSDIVLAHLSLRITLLLWAMSLRFPRRARELQDSTAEGVAGSRNGG